MKQLILIAATSITAAAGTYSALEHAAAARAGDFGFVNVSRALNNDPIYVADDEKINAWRKEQQGQLDQGVRDLEAKAADLESYEEGSEQARKLQEDMIAQEAILKFRKESLNVELYRRRAEALRNGYERLKKAADEVRQAEGLKGVFQYNPDLPTGQSSDQVAAEIVARCVMTIDPAAVDITDAVLTLLKN